MPGSGTRYSKGASNDFSARINFDLSTLRADGTPTTFDNAIENFTARVSQNVDTNRYLLNFSNVPGNLVGAVNLPNPQTLDLDARFVKAGPLTGFDGNVIQGREFFVDELNPSKDSLQQLEADFDRIEYRLDNGELSESGIDELTIFINDADPKAGFQVQAGGEDIDVNLATTDVEYIVEQRLLDSTFNFIRISAEYSQDSKQVVFFERDLSLTDGTEPIPPVAADDSASTRQNTPVNIDVLANDNVGNIDTFDAATTSGGSVALDGDELTYTPATGFTGQDTFTYTTDNLGSKSAAATVTVDVSATGNPTTEPGSGTGPILTGDDVITGDNGDNILDGGEGNNILRGQEGNDVLTTGSGADNLDGGNGNDTLSSGAGNDIVNGGTGNDILNCGAGNDTIEGGSDDDMIFGEAGDDLINGGNGNDTLSGGAGLDTLSGDGGADIFALDTLGGADVIRDFNFGVDRIGLSDGITFDDLIITQGDGAGIISYQDQAIGSVSGASPSQLTANLFTEI